MKEGLILGMIIVVLTSACGREYPTGTFLREGEKPTSDTSYNELYRGAYWISECFEEDKTISLTKESVMYRFNWSRTFDEPMVFTLTVDEAKAEINWKACDGQAGYWNSTKLVIDGSRDLTEAEYKHFVELFDAMKFYDLPRTVESYGDDGAYWTLEARSDHYWAVNRWSPDGPFRECCLYLLELSGLKDQVGDIY